jgi:short-subunit dehydrogenase
MASQRQLVWITGGSAGIGRELALQMANRNMRCAVTARSKDKLDALARSNALIAAFPGDVTDREAMSSAVDQIEASLGAVDVAVLNAGIWTEMGAHDYDAAACEQTMRVNYIGVVNAIDALLPRMIQRGRGHIVIVASVAGYCGLPRLVAYGPTKAALINHAEALMTELDGSGVIVSVVNPGFIDTAMTRDNDFPMPFIISVEEAADKIVRGIERRQFEIAFPWLFALMLKALRRASYPLYFWIVRTFIKTNPEP